MRDDPDFWIGESQWLNDGREYIGVNFGEDYDERSHIDTPHLGDEVWLVYVWNGSMYVAKNGIAYADKSDAEEITEKAREEVD